MPARSRYFCGGLPVFCSDALEGAYTFPACLLSPHSPSLPPLSRAVGVEAPYTLLLRARNAVEAGQEWDSVCEGLTRLEDHLRLTASGGPFFLGKEPSLAEAATAPALFRMIATLVSGALRDD